MSFESSEFEELMGESITVEAFLPTPTSEGAPQYDTANPRTFRCRIEQHARMVRSATGAEVVSQTQVFMAPLTTSGAAYVPTPNDRFTLPAGYSPQQPQPISVQRQNDEQGLHHWVIFL